MRWAGHVAPFEQPYIHMLLSLREAMERDEPRGFMDDIITSDIRELSPEGVN
jgi:hypothetical protein